MTGRSTRRTGPRGDAQRGLTMVEILVTIVLSSLCFAALVPVFVIASQQGSADRAQVAATNTAQSAIERLRDTPYEKLYELYTVEKNGGSNQTKVQEYLDSDLHWRGSTSGVDVEVLPTPIVAKGAERYLSVTVTAWWSQTDEAREEAQEHGGTLTPQVVLKTAIYRRGLGTQTLLVYITPSSGQTITTIGDVWPTARLNAADAALTESVSFRINASNGTPVAQQVVATADAREDGGYTYYEWNPPWNTEALSDGNYWVYAETVPLTEDDVGQWARREYTVDLSRPTQPRFLECIAGFRGNDQGALVPVVHLTWEPGDKDEDIDDYVVLRSENGGTYSPVATVPPSRSSLVDVNVLPDTETENHEYSYMVVAEDQNQQGPMSAPTDAIVVSAVPDPASSVPVPTGPPLPIEVSVPLNSSSVTLTWQSSSGSAVVDGYRVYRQEFPVAGDPGLRMPLKTEERDRDFVGTLTFTDPNVEFGHSYYYFVTALSYDTPLGGTPRLLESSPWAAATALVQIPQPPPSGFIVALKDESGDGTHPDHAHVVVQSLDTGEFYPLDTWDYPEVYFPPAKNPRPQSWSSGRVFAPGSYRVWAFFKDKNEGHLGTYTIERPLDVANDVPVQVVYLGRNSP